MRTGLAVLKKKKTEDGLLKMIDSVMIGKIYTVNLDSVHSLTGYNKKEDKFWTKDFICTIECGECTGALPIEVLDIKDPTTRSDGSGTC